MKRSTIFILILFSLLILVSCSYKEEPKYGNTVAHVGFAGDLIIYDGALNCEKLLIEGEEHLPVFKIDTLEELEQFRSTYGNVFDMNSGKADALSFEGALEKAQWDREGFYKDNTLLIVYVPSSSGSYRYGVKSVETDESSLCIYVEHKNEPQFFTDDEDGWFVLVEADDSEISRYSLIDAILVSTTVTE